MASYNFHTTLRRKITEVLDARTSGLASGQCMDYAAYRHESGYILGLMDALKLADETEKDLD